MSNAEKEKLKKYNKWIQYMIQNTREYYHNSLTDVMVDLMTKKYKYIELQYTGNLPNLSLKERTKTTDHRGIKLVIKINNVDITDHLNKFSTN